MKKFFQSKGFIVTSLAVLCVAILGVCWFASRDRTEDFKPEESPPSSTTSDWSDGGTQTDGESGAGAYAPGQSSSPEEEYPKVTSETEDEVVIDFTDTEKPETTPPPAPEGKTEREDPGEDHPVNPDPEVPKVTTPPRKRSRPIMSRPPGPAMATAPCMIQCLGGLSPVMDKKPLEIAMETSTSRSAIWADQSITEYTPDWPSQNCGGLSILRRTECDVFEATSRPPVQPCPGILFAPFHRVCRGR